MSSNLQATSVQPPEFIQEALVLLFKAAQAGRGREFSSDAVFGIARYIQEIQKANAQAMVAVEGMDRIIMAYVAEHGEDIMTKLFEEELEYDAEIVDESEGSNEVVRVDAQVEGNTEVLEDADGS